MQYQLVAVAACAAVFAYAFLRRNRKLSAIGDVPGPQNPSWIFGMSLEMRPFHLYPWVDGTDRGNRQGHQWYILVEPAGGAEKKFLEDFGGIVHFNGPFGVCFTFYWAHASASHLNSWLKWLVCACRRIACGSRTRRPPTTSFKNPVICTISRPTFGKGWRC